MRIVPLFFADDRYAVILAEKGINMSYGFDAPVTNGNYIWSMTSATNNMVNEDITMAQSGKYSSTDTVFTIYNTDKSVQGNYSCVQRDGGRTKCDQDLCIRLISKRERRREEERREEGGEGKRRGGKRRGGKREEEGRGKRKEEGRGEEGRGRKRREEKRREEERREEGEGGGKREEDEWRREEGRRRRLKEEKVRLGG